MPLWFRVYGMAGLLAGCAPAPLELTPAEARIEAPAFRLPDMEGSQVSLRNFRGGYVFLEFWATWCLPCRMSMLEVEKIHKQFGHRGLVVLGVNTDEDVESARSFVKKKKLRYPTLIAKGTDVAKQYGVDGIPHFVLIDPEGRIAQQWSGYTPGTSYRWRMFFKRTLKPNVREDY